MEYLFTNYFDKSATDYITNITVCITVSVILISIFRPLFSKLFRGGWRYALWITLPVLFLLPIKFQNPFSETELVDITKVPVKIESPPMIFTLINDIGGFQENASEAEIITMGDFLVWIWLAVFILTVLFQVAKLISLQKRINRRGKKCRSKKIHSILNDISAENNIKAPQLVIFPEADTPFAMGIKKPIIILPSEDFSEEELHFIFRHEIIHIKRKDILIKLLLIIFRSANWFNPFAYLMCRQAFEDMEIACDAKVCEGLSEDERKRYSETILQGISKMKYSAATTYFSSGARQLKNRISSVIDIKKIGGLIPFTIMLLTVIYCTASFKPVPKEQYSFYAYIHPFSTESDPYVTTEEWRSCEADSAEEAGKIIFENYMNMYMGEDVPEYFRIEDYHIRDITALGKSESKDPTFLLAFGLLDNKVQVGINYNIEYTNKCGNTVHHVNIINIPAHFNGYNTYNHADLEIEKNGRTYTLTNMGMSSLGAAAGVKHFENAETDTINELDRMARCHLLDYNWNTSDDLPNAEDFNSFLYLSSKEFNPEIKDVFVSGKVLQAEIDTEYLYNAKNADDTGRIFTDGYNFSDSGFVYCGSDFNCETLEMTSYGNVTGENPHGVILHFTAKPNGSYAPIINMLESVTVTEKMFESVNYHDTFDNIPLPENLSDAEEILKYMTTPRDGCDFTVLDYKNITEENGKVYAEVKFKGRLDGIYSSDLRNNMESDRYIKVRII